MITEKAFYELVAQHESDRVEFTTSTGNTDKFCEVVCAFANDLAGSNMPGYLFIGVSDDGKPSGLKVTDELMRNLSSIRSAGNVLPPPALTVQKLVLPDGEVAVVEVKPSHLTPVRYKGKVWVRVGPRKAVANETEERILIEKRASQTYTFDALPCLNATLDDIDIEEFILKYLRKAVDSEILISDNRKIEEKLASLRFYDLRYKCPTNAAIIMFGKKPEMFIPGAYTQFVKFAGKKVVSEVKAQYKYEGNLCEVLPKLDTFIDTTIAASRPVPVSALREENVRNYPHWAIRELMMNALMHRDYQSNAPVRLYEFSDHLEITNPGFLYGESRPENFPRINDYRNPIIAEAMKTLGYVNKFSYGIMRVVEELGENKNGRPQFDMSLLTAFQVTVGISESVNELGYSLNENSETFQETTQKSSQKIEETTQKSGQKIEETTRKSGQKTEETTQKSSQKTEEITQKSGQKTEETTQKSSQKILSIISENNTVTVKELMAYCGLSANGVKKNLVKLKQQGLIRRVGPDKGGHWEIIE